MFSRKCFQKFKRIKQVSLSFKVSTSSLPLNSIKMSPEMMSFHQALPRLPVPPLQSSLEKYLKSVRPFLSDHEFHNTYKLIKEFGAADGLGEKLHKMLVDRANSTDNWLREWWLNCTYLSSRRSLLLDSTAAVMGCKESYNSDEDYLRYAAKLITGVQDFKSHVDNQTFAKYIENNKPVDMSQYYDIFSCCRYPNSPIDSLSVSYLDDKMIKHIIVAHNNHFFSCDIYGDDGKPLNEGQIFAQLQMVFQQSQEPELPVGILTALNRDKWLKAYNNLCRYDKVNEKSIKEIQAALLLLCLDKPVTSRDTTNPMFYFRQQCMNGGGLNKNSGNRWFDKCLQVIVGRDGYLGVAIEHSSIDGQLVGPFYKHIYDYMETDGKSEFHTATSVPKPKKMVFNVSMDSIQDINEAKENINCLVDDHDMSSCTFDSCGTDFFKSMQISTDSCFQMAIQLAFYKLHGEAGAAYESASTRKFLFGRTEMIRSTSIESIAFCKEMLRKSASSSTKAEALKTAIDAHRKYAYEASNGMGVDRLLLGLKMIALESGLEIPPLFTDTGYTRSTHFRLSTSQTVFPHGHFAIFPPLVSNGYGCFYNPQASSITISTSAFNSCSETSSQRFMDTLVESFIEIIKIVKNSFPIDAGNGRK